MDISIRMATLDDVKGIVDVHRSDVSKWYKIVNGKRVEARYEELNVIERWMLGGPWMSIETCAIHINHLLTSGQYPLVAVVEDKIVGELELYIGKDKGPLGKTAFIDIMWVHKDYRGKGVGKSLVNKALEIARKNNCDTISVWPEKKAIAFYKKVGLDKVVYNITSVLLDLERYEETVSLHYSVDSFPQSFKILGEMYLITPRISSSYVIWVKKQCSYAIETSRECYEEGYIPDLDALYIIESLLSDGNKGKLVLWVYNTKNLSDVFKIMFSKAKAIGLKKLHLLVEEEIYSSYIKDRFPHKIESEEIILAKQISQ